MCNSFMKSWVGTLSVDERLRCVLHVVLQEKLENCSVKRQKIVDAYMYVCHLMVTIDKVL